MRPSTLRLSRVNSEKSAPSAHSPPGRCPRLLDQSEVRLDQRSDPSHPGALVPLVQLPAKFLRPVGHLERRRQAARGPLGPGQVPQGEHPAVLVTARSRVRPELFEALACPLDLTEQQLLPDQEEPGAVQDLEPGSESLLALDAALEQARRDVRGVLLRMAKSRDRGRDQPGVADPLGSRQRRACVRDRWRDVRPEQPVQGPDGQNARRADVVGACLGQRLVAERNRLGSAGQIVERELEEDIGPLATGTRLGEASSFSSAIASSGLPASRWKVAARNRRSRASAGSSAVSSAASSASSAAAAVAPRAAACSAAESRRDAATASGPSVASARCRACSSTSATASARARWTERRFQHRRLLVTDRGQQRVREAQARVIELDDAFPPARPPAPPAPASGRRTTVRQARPSAGRARRRAGAHRGSRREAGPGGRQGGPAGFPARASPAWPSASRACGPARARARERKTDCPRSPRADA